MTSWRDGCPVCLNPKADAHPFVHALLAASSRHSAEVHELRLQVADGPRARVIELERTVARLNSKIAELNRRGR